MSHKRSWIQLIIFCVLLLIPTQVTSLSLTTDSVEQKNASDDLSITENISGVIPSVVSFNQSCNVLRQYYAILVGINNYPGSSSDLPYSIHQINAFRNTLLKGGNWRDSNIQMLTNDNATKSAILDAIGALAAKEKRNDLSIIYLVGHGGSNATLESFITYEKSITDKELAMAIDAFEGYLVIIVDCCHSGGFIEELKGEKRIILTACRKNEITYQYEELQSGFFGYFLNRTLEKFTKTTEVTFLFASPLTIRYSEQLSLQLGQDYTVHPCVSDGTLGLMKLINRHRYFSSLATLFFEPFLNLPYHGTPRNIWRH